MAQFTLYINPNPRSKETYPYLLDVQAPLLQDLSTRVVIPMGKLPKRGAKPISHLCPVIEYDGSKWVLYTQELAGVPITKLGKPAGDLSHCRAEIISALDFLFTGI